MSWRLAPTLATVLLAYRCFSVTVSLHAASDGIGAGCGSAGSIATLGQAVAGHGPAVSIIGVLVMWRFIMGVGIGGDYPLSSVITSEFAATRIRGRMMSRPSGRGFVNSLEAVIKYVMVFAARRFLR
ncbi:hypothetical protein NBRC10512_003169 [Rhodotorula toruloides]